MNVYQTTEETNTLLSVEMVSDKFKNWKLRKRTPVSLLCNNVTEEKEVVFYQFCFFNRLSLKISKIVKLKQTQDQTINLLLHRVK